MKGLARAAGLVSALTLLSRVLGLVREQVYAALLGAGPQADAFQIAFRIPNLLRDMFAEGALSAAFVPTYARALKEGGKAEGHRLVSRLLTLLTAILGVLVLLGIVFAEPLVALLAPGFDEVPGKTALTVLLTRIMMPFLPLVSFAAVAMGMLNAEERFSTPALSPAMFNVVTILWGALLWGLGFDPVHVAVGWAVGTLLGGVAQLATQVPPLRQAGWRFVPEWAPGDPGLRRIGSLMAPATVGLAAVQVNVFVNSIFASHEPGAVSWLQFAFRILYLPIGLFGVAVGTVATSGLARRAAEDDLVGLRATLRQALSLVTFLNVPATVGLMVLGVPIVRLLYERGRFAAEPGNTEATAAALLFYSFGLVAYTSVKVLAPAFYALGSPRVPLLASALAVAANLAINLFGHERFGFRAVALGASVGSLANALVLLAVLQARLGGVLDREVWSRFGRILLAALAMAPVAWLSWRWLERAVGTHGLLAQALTCLPPVGLGVLTYGAAAALLGLPETRQVWRLLRGRLRAPTAANP
ncbi:MAG: murein biosynthesis integral membrane protein MurJ [Acidobacteria bacterium]|nr:MAG: murein biosynthesis integral membrane protein MurJ [Acidobacteriota bacterium]